MAVVTAMYMLWRLMWPTKLVHHHCGLLRDVVSTEKSSASGNSNCAVSFP